MNCNWHSIFLEVDPHGLRTSHQQERLMLTDVKSGATIPLLEPAGNCGCVPRCQTIRAVRLALGSRWQLPKKATTFSQLTAPGIPLVQIIDMALDVVPAHSIPRSLFINIAPGMALVVVPAHSIPRSLFINIAPGIRSRGYMMVKMGRGAGRHREGVRSRACRHCSHLGSLHRLHTYTIISKNSISIISRNSSIRDSNSDSVTLLRLTVEGSPWVLKPARLVGGVGAEEECLLLDPSCC